MSLIFNRKEMESRRRTLRRNATPAERKLWAAIRNKQIEGARFRRQYSIGALVADFYCPEKKLVIEVDGGYHRRPDIMKKDAARQKRIENLEISVFRLTNEEIETDFDNALRKIREAVKRGNGQAG